MASRSFMDAIKSVGRKSADLTEGAKDKTSDGMTKDAKHFAQDLHKVQDSGMKHLVQKDSETKDYENMFKGDVEKFPTRPADMEPSQSVDKYVEYNEAVQLEAKKLSKKDDQKPGDNPDNEDATGPMEAVVNPVAFSDASKKAAQAARTPYTSPVTPGGAAGGLAAGTRNFRGYSAPPTRVVPSGTKPVPSPMAGQGTSALPKSPMAGQGTAKPAAPAKPGASEAGATGFATSKKTVTNVKRDTMYGGSSAKKITSTGNPNMAGGGAGGKKVTSTGNPNMAGSGSGGVKVVPTGGPPPAQGAKPGASAAKPKKPGASVVPPKKPGVAQQIKPDRPAGTPRTGGTHNNDVGPGKPRGGVVTGKVTGTTATSKPRVAGVNNLRQSYEIEWNGNSYVMNEAAIEALGTFIEKYGQVNEVVDMTNTKEVVHDFVHSKNKKFAGDSTKERIRRALGASYAAKRGK